MGRYSRGACRSEDVFLQRGNQTGAWREKVPPLSKAAPERGESRPKLAASDGFLDTGSDANTYVGALGTLELLHLEAVRHRAHLGVDDGGAASDGEHIAQGHIPIVGGSSRKAGMEFQASKKVMP